MARVTREERKRRTRAALVEAAAEVFARRGFGAARVEEIAERAELTTGALYAHFASKQELFLAVFEEFAAVRARQVEDSAGSLRSGADLWMRMLDEAPWRFWLHLEFASYAIDDPQLRERFAVRVGAVRLAIARLLADRYGGELTVSPEWLAAVIRALGMGLSIERLVDPDAIPPQMFGDAVELIVAACTREAGVAA
jgi:AcrR family transcriptional regulator